ncbi:MAG: hypothetical protein Q7W05_12080 [Deltaproteobacteria bacterium]|nr:hypothetical protein [Deltaproteobacteria bacterium]
MKKRIMVIIIILGLASLATAQTTPQNIINAKISEGYCALSLTDGAISSDVLRQSPNLETGPKKQLKNKEQNIAKILASLGQSHKSNSGLPKKSNETKTRNIRTVYN